jgi:hypothetical protein
MSFDVSFVSKHPKKNHCMKRDYNSKISSPHPLQVKHFGKGGNARQYFLDIVLERDIPIRQEYPDFLNFWDKFPTSEGTDAVQL